MSITSVAIIQARATSVRLPGKVFLDVPQESGVSMLMRVVTRLAQCRELSKIVVAIPGEQYSQFEGVLRGIHTHLGDEFDVLGRTYDAARHARAEIVVRVTSDCPLVDPVMVDRMVLEFVDGDFDYLSNCHPQRTVPPGFDVEVFSMDALRIAHFSATQSAQREHVTLPLYSNSSSYVRIGMWAPPEGPWPTEALPELSVDTPVQYRRVCDIYRSLKDPSLSTYDEVRRLCL